MANLNAQNIVDNAVYGAADADTIDLFGVIGSGLVTDTSITFTEL